VCIFLRSPFFSPNFPISRLCECFSRPKEPFLALDDVQSALGCVQEARRLDPSSSDTLFYLVRIFVGRLLHLSVHRSISMSVYLSLRPTFLCSFLLLCTLSRLHLRLRRVKWRSTRATWMLPSTCTTERFVWTTTTSAPRSVWHVSAIPTATTTSWPRTTSPQRSATTRIHMRLGRGGFFLRDVSERACGWVGGLAELVAWQEMGKVAIEERVCLRRE
jgi:hypothetical protein